MAKGNLIGAVILAICCFVCAGVFLGVGLWADKLKKPVHFWAGCPVDPGKVTDILEYNRANGVMWKVYSSPYWISGLFACLGYFSEICTYISVAALGLACVPGLYLLIRQYHKIEKRFILR